MNPLRTLRLRFPLRRRALATAAQPPPATLGATPTTGGASFCVWAPNADAVAIRLTDQCRVEAMDRRGEYWLAEVRDVPVGERYQYLVRSAGTLLTRVDPYARQTDEGAQQRSAVLYDESRFEWRAPAFSAAPLSDLVIYEMHVGTFNDLAGQQVGTFDDAAAKLPYLVELGVNAVELLPPSQFDGTLSWGYNPTDPFAVESEYGGPDALKRYIARAHQAGIAVFIDVVYNHMGTVNNDLWDYDGAKPAPGGIWFYPDWRMHTDWGSRPDYDRPEVRRYFVDNALAWLRDYRADGLRFDATAYVRSADGSLSIQSSLPNGWLLLQAVNDAIRANTSGKVRIAEDMRNDPAITLATSAGGAGFDSQWDPDFVRQVRGVLEAVRDEDRDMNLIAAALERCYDPEPFSRVVFTESHDADANGGTRVPTEIDPGDPTGLYAKKRSILGAVLVFTAPGIPMIFQGQEFLETHYFDAQFPVDWANAERFIGIRRLYRDLIRLRRNLEGTTAGLSGAGLQVHHVNQYDKLIAYHRWAAGGPLDDTVVLINFANRAFPIYTAGLPSGGTWRVRLNTDWRGYDSQFGGQAAGDVRARNQGRDGLPSSGDLAVGAYAAVILSQDGE